VDPPSPSARRAPGHSPAARRVVVLRPSISRRLNRSRRSMIAFPGSLAASDRPFRDFALSVSEVAQMCRAGSVDGHRNIHERRLARMNGIDPAAKEEGILVGARIVVAPRPGAVMVLQRRRLLATRRELVELAIDVQGARRAVAFDACPY